MSHNVPWKEGNKVTEIRLGAGDLKYVEIWGYKPNHILLKKQHLCQGFLAAGWQNCLFFFFSTGMYTEKPEILKRVMSLNIASDSTVQE